MHLLFADKLMDNRLIQALSWTLIHSLWQGMLAAIIAGIIILTTKKATALLRYNLLSGLFAALILSTIITFGFEYASAFSNQTNVNNVVNTIPINDLDHSSYTQNEEPISYLTLFKNYFNNNAPLIVLLWFLFFMVQSIRLFAGLHYIHRIRFNKISDPDDVWKDKLQALCRQLGIQQKLLFLQSQIIKTPVVIGYFKPTILVPLGLLTNLPAEQVETILLHELAHIRRKDYLVNLLQSFAEAVFFFNPAIIWISSLIREEREACCDDIVMNNTVNKGSYLEALVSFHQHTNTKNTYALALNGQNSFLFNRVKRMITYENKKLNIMEKLFLLSGVLVFSAFTFITNKNQPLKVLPLKAGASAQMLQPSDNLIKGAQDNYTANLKELPPATVLDTVPKSKPKISSISTSIDEDGKTKTSDIKVKGEDGKTYRIKKVNSTISEFYVDDVRIPESEIGNYKGMIEEIETMQAKHREVALKRLAESKAKREATSQRLKEQRLMLEKNRKATEHRNRIVHNKRAQEFEERRLFNEKRAMAGRGVIADRLMEHRSKLATTQALRAKEQRRDLKMQHGINQRAIELNRSKRAMALPSNSNATALIINELVNSNVIESTDKLKFTLDSKKLVVNGKKQSAELHQRLKERFLKGDKDSIEYSKSNDGTKTTIVTN